MPLHSADDIDSLGSLKIISFQAKGLARHASRSTLVSRSTGTSQSGISMFQIFDNVNSFIESRAICRWSPADSGDYCGDIAKQHGRWLARS